MPRDNTLSHFASRIGRELGTDWRDISPEVEPINKDVWEMSAHVWLHLLSGVKYGHLLTFINTKNGPILIHRDAWPEAPPLADATRHTFATLRASSALAFSYETSDATYIDSQRIEHQGKLCVDRITARSFQAFFNPEPYVLNRSRRWNDIGQKGDIPALLMGDLLLDWSKAVHFDRKAMRRSIIHTLENSVQRLSNREKWLTPHGVFRGDGSLVTPIDIQHMENWSTAVDEELENHWTNSWVIGREWLRAFCEQDPTNRPFPAFWETPPPQPSITTHIQKPPSPLKGRTHDDIHTRNSDWLSRAQGIRNHHPDWSKSNICRKVAKDLGIPDKWDSVRRALHREDPNWDKKVGQG